MTLPIIQSKSRTVQILFRIIIKFKKHKNINTRRRNLDSRLFDQTDHDDEQKTSYGRGPRRRTWRVYGDVRSAARHPPRCGSHLVHDVWEPSRRPIPPSPTSRSILLVSLWAGNQESSVVYFWAESGLLERPSGWARSTLIYLIL